MGRNTIFSKIKNLFRKKVPVVISQDNSSSTSTPWPFTQMISPSTTTTGTYTINSTATYGTISTNLGGAAQAVGTVNIGGGGGGGGGINQPPAPFGSGYGTFTTSAPIYPTTAVTFYKTNAQEIVRLTPEGKVIWANDIDVDAAAEAFARSIRLGAEISAGITKSVKLDMRDSVFQDIIDIAKEKGPLSAEDLTYLLEASKIVEKLQGGKGIK